MDGKVRLIAPSNGHFQQSFCEGWIDRPEDAGISIYHRYTASTLGQLPHVRIFDGQINNKQVAGGQVSSGEVG